jgi:hypothetical protein
MSAISFDEINLLYKYNFWFELYYYGKVCVFVNETILLCLVKKKNCVEVIFSLIFALCKFSENIISHLSRND